MAHIELVDETLRDGQQCVWGMRMTAGMALPVTPLLDRTGFSVIDLTAGAFFECLVKYCQENPWEGMDLLVQSMPRTTLRGGTRANGAISFGVTPDALMDLWMRQLNRHGCKSFWIYDVLYNIDKMHRLAKIAKEFGSKVAGSLMFAQSPVHTDAYYADKARRLVASPDIDSLLLYDMPGALDKERLQTLIPAIRAAGGGKPIEFHANNRLGQSAKAYLDAIDLGVTIFHTASRPLANGPSVPSTEVMASNVELLGHTHNLDKRLFEPVADHFERVGKTAGFLVNQHSEYDLEVLQNQFPGGMIGTLKAQLAQHGMSDALDSVFKESARVRKDLGYPGMATPFSQIVGTLSVLNILTKERYSSIPDQAIQYAAGFYGEPAGPIDPDVLDRIMSAPRAKEVLDNPPPQPTIEELRKQYATNDDDELILRASLPEDSLARMRAAGPVKTNYPYFSSSDLDQVGRLIQVANTPVVQFEAAELELKLRRFGQAPDS